MNATLNSDGNLFGRFVALILIAGGAFAAQRLAGGGAIPPASVSQEAVPVEASKAKVRKSVKKAPPLETALPPAE